MKKQVLLLVTASLLAAAIPVLLIATIIGPVSIINIALSVAVPAGGLGFWEEYDKKKLTRHLIAIFLSAAVLCGLLAYFKI